MLGAAIGTLGSGGIGIIIIASVAASFAVQGAKKSVSMLYDDQNQPIEVIAPLATTGLD